MKPCARQPAILLIVGLAGAHVAFPRGTPRNECRAWTLAQHVGRSLALAVGKTGRVIPRLRTGWFGLRISQMKTRTIQTQTARTAEQVRSSPRNPRRNQTERWR